MTLKSIAVKAGIATIALTAMGLVAAAPASAHTNNMYTYVYSDDQIEQSGFATYSKTNGTTAFLPSTGELYGVRGIEVANEKGTLVGSADGYYTASWNHTTGEFGTFLPLTIPGADQFNNVIGLDTLNNGTTITLVEYAVDFGEVTAEFHAIASLNDAGQLTPIVDLTPVLVSGGQPIYSMSSLATDPASGLTYVFLRHGQTGDVYFLLVNVAANSVGVPTRFDGTGFGPGEFRGADFDSDSTLYFNHYDQQAEVDDETLSKVGAPSTWPTAERIEISTAPAEAFRTIELLALTIEHTALADTGSELPLAAWLLVGTVAVLAGGVTVTVARRRSEAGTV